MNLTGIDRTSATFAVQAHAGGGARSTAADAIGEIGHRVLAWVGASGGASASGSAAWSATARSSGFNPDASELARGGDVYELNALAATIAGSTGATPSQEGDLRRALEDFTREAVVQVAGLAGSERQVDGLKAALDIAVSADAGEGADGVIARVELATASLSAANGH